VSFSGQMKYRGWSCRVSRIISVYNVMRNMLHICCALSYNDYHLRIVNLDSLTQQTTDRSHCYHPELRRLLKLNFVRSEVPMAVGSKKTVLWDATPCSVVDVYQCRSGTCCFYLFFSLEDGDNTSLWDIHKFLTNMSHPRTKYSLK
jgi:hypothetical protein